MSGWWAGLGCLPTSAGERSDLEVPAPQTHTGTGFTCDPQMQTFFQTLASPRTCLGSPFSSANLGPRAACRPRGDTAAAEPFLPCERLRLRAHAPWGETRVRVPLTSLLHLALFLVPRGPGVRPALEGEALLRGFGL